MPERQIQEMFKEAWSQALVGLNTAEQEAEKVLARIGFSPEDVKRHAREFGERLAGQRREIERAVDDAVKRAAGRFKLPTRDDVDALKARVDEISARVDAIAKQKEPQA